MEGRETENVYPVVEVPGAYLLQITHVLYILPVRSLPLG